MDKQEEIEVLIFTPERIIYRGKVHSLILPGEKGVFEVLPYHKPLISRLMGGFMILNGKHFQIKRGAAKVGLNRVVIVIEEVMSKAQ